MSDRELRELERRWKETGTDEDAAAYYRARLRSQENLTTKLIERILRLERMAGVGDWQDSRSWRVYSNKVTHGDLIDWLDSEVEPYDEAVVLGPLAWGDPVDTWSDLPAEGRHDGEARPVAEDSTVAVWDASRGEWSRLESIGAGHGLTLDSQPGDALVAADPPVPVPLPPEAVFVALSPTEQAQRDWEQTMAMFGATAEEAARARFDVQAAVERWRAAIGTNVAAPDQVDPTVIDGSDLDPVENTSEAD
jgi:hypothetical protein